MLLKIVLWLPISDKNILKHLGIIDSKNDCKPIRYHQICELKESVVNYNFNDFPKSLIKMIQKNGLESYLSKRV